MGRFDMEWMFSWKISRNFEALKSVLEDFNNYYDKTAAEPRAKFECDMNISTYVY